MTHLKRRDVMIAGIAAVLMCAYVFLQYPENHFFSATEAKTFFFANNFFTITLLKTTIAGEMPLYYLAAHFLIFSGNPADLVVLKLFSAFMLGAAFGVALKTALYPGGAESRIDDSGFGRTGIILRMLASIVLVAVFAQAAHVSGLSADPGAAGVFFSAVSLLYFTQFFLCGQESSEKKYIVFTLLALYTARMALYVLLFQLLLAAVLRYVRREKTPPFVTGAPGRISVLFIPGLLILLRGLAGGRGLFPLEIFSFAQAGADTVTAAVNIQVFVALALGVSIAALMLKSNAATGGRAAAAAVLLIASILVIAPLAVIHSRNIDLMWQRAGAAAELFTPGKELSVNMTDSFVFLYAAGETGPELLEFYMLSSGMELLRAGHEREIGIVPLRENDMHLLDLGPRFRELNETAAEKDPLFDLKEAFLTGDGVWVLNYCSDTEPRDCRPGLLTGRIKDEKRKAIIEGAIAWLDANVVAERQESYGSTVNAARYVLKDEASRDAILFDLFVNSYGDYEKAARLVSSPGFDTGAVRADLDTLSDEKRTGIIDSIAAGCRGAAECIANISQLSKEPGSKL